MISNRIVEIYNRTDVPLIAIKNGQEYEIPPGRSHMRADVIPFAKNQNPVPGTDNGMTTESLIAVVADASKGEQQVDPMDDLPQAVIQMLAKERIDRSQLPLDRQQGLRHIEYAKLRRGNIALQEATEGMVDGSHLGR